MDSGCSHSMSGVLTRLIDPRPLARPVVISGFNGDQESASLRGINPDGRQELYVPSMPSDLALLSAHEYSKDGAIILFPDRGVVLSLNNEERLRFSTYIDQFKKTLCLKVNHGTYEVARDTCCDDCLPPFNDLFEYGYNASTFFNAKVSYNTVEEYILGLMLSGFPFRQLQHFADHPGAITGIDYGRLTRRTLSDFEHRHGRTPDIVQLANNEQHQLQVRAFDDSRPPCDHVGDTVEVDGLFMRWTEETHNYLTDDRIVQKQRTRKLASHGGAISGMISVDKYSGYVIGKLCKPNTTAMEFLKETISKYQIYGHEIRCIAADVGMVSVGHFNILTSKTQEYLRNLGIEHRKAEPGNHSNGTPMVESEIKWIKRVHDIAYAYADANWNQLKHLGFTKTDLYQLWGEVFHWAINVRNCFMCRREPSVTKHEVFYRNKGYGAPNIQRIRLFPIFSVVMVLMDSPTQGPHRQPFYVPGLYCGPDWQGAGTLPTTGNIRVAVRTTLGITIKTTSDYKNVTQGGNLNINNEIRSGFEQLSTYQPPDEDFLNDSLEDTGATTPAEAAPEDPQEPCSSPESVRLSSSTEPDHATLPTTMNTQDWTEDVDTVEHDLPSAQPLPPSSDSAIDSLPTASLPVGTPQPGSRGATKRYDPTRHSSRAERQDRRQSLSLSAKNSPQENSFSNRESLSVSAENLPEENSFSNREYFSDIIHAHFAKLGTTRERVIEKIEQKYSFLSLSDGAIMRVNRCPKTCSSKTFFSGDWTTYNEKTIYFNYKLGAFVTLNPTDMEIPISPESRQEQETAYMAAEPAEALKAVTGGTPKTLAAAISHPEWGEAARFEFNDVKEKALVEVPRELAIREIRNGADVVMLFPVYEEKIRDGKLVRKVRLVGDGRTHHTAKHTYSETPSREEFLVFLHLIASRDWEWCLIDESRAFLNARRQDMAPLYARIRGSPEFWKVLGALYGLKTSTRDHSDLADRRLKDLGYVQCDIYKGIYVRVTTNGISFVFRYVDDNFFAASTREHLQFCIDEFRKIVPCSEPVYEPTKGLGMEFERDRERRIIKVRMVGKIQEIVKEYEEELKRFHSSTRYQPTPLSKSRFLIRDADFESDKNQYSMESDFVEEDGQRVYLKIVGSLLWINGVRHDISFSITHLTWFTSQPRYHHLSCAYQVIYYLRETMNTPLVLGGKEPAELICISDASLGIGPRTRSIICTVVRLSEHAGAVRAKTKALDYVTLSSFESELNGYFEATKQLARYRNLLHELHFDEMAPMRRMIGDNEKAIEFIKGDAEGRGVRHALLRMNYMQEQYKLGDLDVQWKEGEGLTSDMGTKPGTGDQMRAHREDVQGLYLLR